MPPPTVKSQLLRTEHSTVNPHLTMSGSVTLSET